LRLVPGRKEATIYVIRSGAGARGHQVPEDILGPDFDSYLVVDGLRSYGVLEVAKGRCNGHLLRRCKDLQDVVSSKEQPFLESLSTLLEDAIDLARRRDQLTPTGHARRVQEIEQRLDDWLDGPPRSVSPELDRLDNHIRAHRGEWLVFLHDGFGPCARRLSPSRIVDTNGPMSRSRGEDHPMPAMNPRESLRRLGDFELVRELGRGGMGVVYEARQVSLNRKVALKVLSGGLGLTDRAVQRFRREAEAAAKLHHTNIVPVYATGEQDGTHFYAMELIEGPSLDHVIRQLRASQAGAAQAAEPARGLVQTTDYDEGANTAEGIGLSTSSLSSGGAYFDTVAQLVAEVADALDHAHNNGVIHRDIKPSNLLLSPAGRPSVNDFGLARMLEQPGMTMTGEFVGTPAYMSPEQITAGRILLDHRTDIYSLGATLYELLTFQPPFRGQSREQVLAQIVQKEPRPPRKLNPKVPVDLETVCLKALEKDPDRRYPTAAALADDLRRYLNRFAITARRVGPIARLIKLTRRHKLATMATSVLFLLTGITGVMSVLYHRSQQEISQKEAETREEQEKADLARRQREAGQKIRDVERLIKEQKFQEAFVLLQHEITPYLPDEPRLEELRSECSYILSLVSDPPGADMFRKPYDSEKGAWEHLGRTPIDKLRVARGFYHWKLEKPGYETAEGFGRNPQQVQLDPQGSHFQGMVRVTVRGGLPLVSGLRTQDLALGPFYLDRHEVTNRQFKQFVDRGGYQKKEFWEHSFVKDGKPLTWQEAIDGFRDATGRPGPATWEWGSYPHGQDEHPVAGVSWYEAAAYARFAGKALPTIYHWLAASGLELAREIIPRSNFGRTGPAKVGHYQGLGPFGTYDMAGNVKEWCFNSAGDGKRYLLGGAWGEQEYMFAFPDVRSPFHRARNCGFRCVKYLPGQEPAQEAFREEKRPHRDFLREKLLADTEFAIVRSAYDYDKERDLNARVDRDGETAHWVRERVEYDAGYGKERAVTYLFLPRPPYRPPYQPVIHWPGANAITSKAIEPWAVEQKMAFLVRSGRAVVWPIYKGTYERSVEPLRGAAEEWELHIRQANDLRRAIDYLQTRNDLDTRAIGYYGLSWGAVKGAWLLALEDRIKAAVLMDGGLWLGPLWDGRAGFRQFQRPEADALHYLPRIKVPVLMLNGEYDALFPRVESQEPMFQRLGAPNAHKKHLLTKDSHIAIIEQQRIQETVNWFDTYLGPVTPK
jgi:serine/threonine protein kinase